MNDPIKVIASRGRPRVIRLGERVYHVRELLAVWIYQSRWWGREERRVYFRVRTNQNVLEIWQNEGEWRLARVLD